MLIKNICAFQVYYQNNIVLLQPTILSLLLLKWHWTWQLQGTWMKCQFRDFPLNKISKHFQENWNLTSLEWDFKNIVWLGNWESLQQRHCVNSSLSTLCTRLIRQLKAAFVQIQLPGFFHYFSFFLKCIFIHLSMQFAFAFVACWPNN